LAGLVAVAPQRSSKPVRPTPPSVVKNTPLLAAPASATSLLHLNPPLRIHIHTTTRQSVIKLNVGSKVPLPRNRVCDNASRGECR